MRQIRNLHERVVVLLEHLRADRHFERDICSGLAGPVRAFAVRAAARLELLLKSEIEERIEVRVRDEIDISTGSAVAATGAAARNELFAAERHRAAPAVAGRDVNVDFVNEHVWRSAPPRCGGSFQRLA